MLGLLIIGSAILGLLVGSFLNVVIYRVPLGLSVVLPSSYCPKCHVPILARDNIPIASWVRLRGRCRNCNEHISAQYMAVETACGVLFALTAARVGTHLDLLAFFVLLASLLALSLIDLQHLILPRKIIYVSLAIVLAIFLIVAALDNEWGKLLVAVACAVAWFLVFFLINAISPRALGFGDVRLAPLLGLSLGWLGVSYVIVGFFMANLIGAVIGIALVLTKRMERGQQIPYAIFLSMGCTLAIFAGSIVALPLQKLLGF